MIYITYVEDDEYGHRDVREVLVGPPGINLKGELAKWTTAWFDCRADYYNSDKTCSVEAMNVHANEAHGTRKQLLERLELREAKDDEVLLVGLSFMEAP